MIARTACVLALALIAAGAGAARAGADGWSALGTLPAGTQPQVGLDPSGRSAVAYQRGTDQLVLARGQAGRLPAPPSRIGVFGGFAAFPPVPHFDASGAVALATSPDDSEPDQGVQALMVAPSGAVAKATLAPTSAYNGQLALAAGGTLVAAWAHDAGDQPQIEIAERPVGAAAFGPATAVVGAGADIDKGPVLAAGEDGTLALAWQAEGKLLVALRSPAGTWGAPEDTGLEFSGDASDRDVGDPPAIAVAGDGEVLVAALVKAHDDVGGSYVLATGARAATGGWAPPATLASEAGPPEFAVAAAHDGSGVLAWTDDGVLRAALRGPGGAPGAASTISRPGQLASELALAMAPSGLAVAAWSTGTSVQAALRPPGAGFLASETLNPVGHFPTSPPALALAADGSALAAWSSTSDDDTSIEDVTGPIEIVRRAPGPALSGGAAVLRRIRPRMGALKTRDLRRGVLTARVSCDQPCWLRARAFVVDSKGLPLTSGKGSSFVAWGDIRKPKILHKAGSTILSVTLPAPLRRLLARDRKGRVRYGELDAYAVDASGNEVVPSRRHRP
jgi:hypothetical protein